jgi:hypothetical protein
MNKMKAPSLPHVCRAPEKAQPEKTSEFGKKIIVAAGSLCLVLLGVAVANAPDSASVSSPVQLDPVPVNARPPVDGVVWNDTYKSWLCPVDNLNSGRYEQCSADNYPSAADREEITKLNQCIGRSGKTRGSAGESWAAAQCRENNNSF